MFTIHGPQSLARNIIECPSVLFTLAPACLSKTLAAAIVSSLVSVLRREYLSAFLTRPWLRSFLAGRMLSRFPTFVFSAALLGARLCALATNRLSAYLARRPWFCLFLWLAPIWSSMHFEMRIRAITRAEPRAIAGLWLEGDTTMLTYKGCAEPIVSRPPYCSQCLTFGDSGVEYICRSWNLVMVDSTSILPYLWSGSRLGNGLSECQIVPHVGSRTSPERSV